MQMVVYSSLDEVGKHQSNFHVFPCILHLFIQDGKDGKADCPPTIDEHVIHLGSPLHEAKHRGAEPPS